ncbi:M48 family metalloprotease [Cohnella abietis]|uniref:Uncharacterized protein n=1 Tax=Cohnella abietis TaxID=2507935 RepID=A0A3T1DA34_9BACL|nr:M48 family metalloprotease [Cohnella abietis]BBI34945.1 hypothetical protein KCTCHS21_43440 [Cohnella abietis]
MSLLNINILRLMQEQSHALNTQLKKLETSDFPSKDNHTFIKEAISLNKLFFSFFNSDDPSQISQQDIQVMSYLFRYFLMNIYPRIEHSTDSHHPLEVMIPVKEIIEKITPGANVITSPEYAINYSIGEIWQCLARPINSLNKFPTINENKTIMLTFPKLHKNNVLFGCIMGHEIGHYIDLHCGFDLSSILYKQLCQFINIQSIRPYVVNGQQLTDQEIQLSLPDMLRPVYYNWVKEYVADILGIILYGPASHFSSEQIFMLYGVEQGAEILKDSIAQSHPRRIARSRIKRRTMEKLNFTSYLSSDVIQLMDSWHHGWENAQGMTFTYETNSFKFNHAILIELEELFLSNLDQIIDAIISFCSVKSIPMYTSTEFNQITGRLVAKIEGLIPPNELDGNPVSSISILNAGWISYFQSLQVICDETKNQDKNAAQDILNNLIRKALYSGHIHRRWIDAATNTTTN